MELLVAEKILLDSLGFKLFGYCNISEKFMAWRETHNLQPASGFHLGETHGWQSTFRVLVGNEGSCFSFFNKECDS